MCLDSIDVAILCGGLGTRLGLVDKPKCLAEVAGRPFLEHLLELLHRHGAERVVLLTGHLADQVAAHTFPADLKVELVYDKAMKGTAKALINAIPALTSPYVLVCNGDTWTDVDLCRLVMVGHNVRRPAILMTRSYAGDIDDSGFCLLSQKHLEALAWNGPDNLESWFYAHGHRAFFPGTFLDIGTPERLAQAQQVLA